MSQPIPNLPHFPVDPASSGAVFEQMRNELETWCRSVADNMGRGKNTDTPPWVALRVLRVTGSPTANWYTCREQRTKKGLVLNPATAFSATGIWEDINDKDDAYLLDPSSGSAIASGSYVASWFQMRGFNNLPTFLLMAGAGGALPVGQYQYMVFGNVAQNQTGFFFPRAHPVI